MTEKITNENNENQREYNKGFSDENFTLELKNKLLSLSTQEQIPVSWNAKSGKGVILHKPTKLSQFQNDMNFAQKRDVPKSLSELQNDLGLICLKDIPQGNRQTQGKLSISTPEEVKEGSNDSKAVTPKLLKEALDERITGFLNKDSNLRDIKNKAIARSNLDLGTMSVLDKGIKPKQFRNNEENEKLFLKKEQLKEFKNELLEETVKITLRDTQPFFPINRNRKLESQIRYLVISNCLLDLPEGKLGDTIEIAIKKNSFLKVTLRGDKILTDSGEAKTVDIVDDARLIFTGIWELH